jgi:hypothetical protein
MLSQPVGALRVDVAGEGGRHFPVNDREPSFAEHAGRIQSPLLVVYNL